MLLKKPDPEEYLPYYQTYIRLAPEGEITEIFKSQQRITTDFFSSINEEKALYRYAPDKWSVREILGHLLDTERIFPYRAWRFSRNDNTVLPGYDQDAFIAQANYNQRKITNILAEFNFLRESNILMFASFSGDMWAYRGTANNLCISVRSVPFIMIGHEIHHINVIKERYLE